MADRKKKEQEFTEAFQETKKVVFAERRAWHQECEHSY